MIDTDTRDRVIRMEAEVDNLEKKVDDMSKKIDDMHDVLMQARGARYILAGAAALAGGVTGFLVKVIPFSHSLPK
jgi:tetrahydromethanopterin S-methyltransferase subunit G